MLRSYRGWNALYWAVLLVAIVCAAVRFFALSLDLPTAYLRDDFNHYYATAWLLNAGQVPYGVSFASLDLGARFEWTEYTPMATNPPVLAMLSIPLAWTLPQVSWMIWESLVVASLFLCFGLIFRELRPNLTGKTIILFCMLAVSAAPVARLIEHGQVQSLILLTVVLGWIAARRNAWTAAAVLWGFAAAVKFYAWPLLLVLLRKDKKSFFVGICSAILISLLPVALFGWAMYTGFVESALPLLSSAFYHLGHNMSVGRSVAQLFAVFGLLPETYPVLHFVVSIAVPCLIVAAVALTFAKNIGNKKQLDLLVAIVCSWAFLCSPTAWTNYTLALFFPAAVVLAYTTSIAVPLALTLGWSLLLVSPLPSSPFMPVDTDLYYGLIRNGFILALLALTFGARAMCREEEAVVEAEETEPERDRSLAELYPELAAKGV